MSELIHLTFSEAKKKLINKEISVKELTAAHLSRAEATKNLNAYTELTAEFALEKAAQSQKKYDSGTPGIIEGMPIGVKDLYCTKGFKSTACSKILKDFTPTYESTVSQNMFNNGGIMVGKTGMDEFAMGSANIHSCQGNVINPWKSFSHNKDLVPGGSSGGSAAAVAAKSCMASLGSDTGGSVRQPASFTGIVGMKPTYGRCSRYGMIAFSSSLDQAGVFARSVEDSALLIEAIAGFDPKDSTSSNITVPNFIASINNSVKGKKVGIPKEYMVDGMPKEISDLWTKGAEMLKAAGAEIVEVSLPHTKYALPTYYIIAPAEASSNLARYDGVRYGLRSMPDKGGINDLYEQTRCEGFGDEVKRRLMIGTYVLSAGYYDAYYTKAQKVRQKIANDFKEAYKQVDVILTPTTPSAAFAIGENTDDPVKMYLNDVLTVPASLAGLPCISVPAGLTADGLPLGLQIIGNLYDESSVLNFAKIIEDAAKFKCL
ncbi:MAG: Asp-tRNA(Asn)/Glu-tRNA(Gln) amidotransferase subunit GatA [Rickettsiales bacterium]